ncbi:Tetratricopeptide TPR-1 [Lasiodiplodia theobromae]|nr:Tetratricopeptide TPR-1 [Lasiodiplodia theobromae]KAF4539360.1 Tetratricopeptide TPR-1 [Lasiodiplodia theobromae]
MGPVPDKVSRDRLLQVPQQYAHPLQRTNSFPLRGSPKEGQASSERSENMLRRKTPNGIIPEAYDGSASEKPHAMKHILLPVTTVDGVVQQPVVPYGPTQELPLRTPGMIPQGSHNQPQQRMLPVESWDLSQFNFDPPNVSRKRGQQQFSQIDSMLNQVPTPQQQLQYLQMGQHFGGALQPPLQAPLGPTVSNETGLYGPYWPDGTNLLSSLTRFRLALLDTTQVVLRTGWHRTSIILMTTGFLDNSNLHSSILDPVIRLAITATATTSIAIISSVPQYPINQLHITREMGCPEPMVNNMAIQQPVQPADTYRSLRRMSATMFPSMYPSVTRDLPGNALSAIDQITQYCQESSWKWIDGILVGGCLAYALGDYQKALVWYSKILDMDPDHVEALSNVAATLHSLGRKHEAEQHWWKAIQLRPSYFEAVEHLVQLLCTDHRGKEAVNIINHIERALQLPKTYSDRRSEVSSGGRSPQSEVSDKPVFEYDGEQDSLPKDLNNMPGSDSPGFGTSGYAISGSENGRMLSLIHAKGNLLYSMGDNAGAAKAFENAVLISAGKRAGGISNLIKHILKVVDEDEFGTAAPGAHASSSIEPILLPPVAALRTAQLAFPNNGELPGLRYISSKGMARKAAVSTTSNSLLSLAKIFQDGMASGLPKAAYQSAYGVREILALYYLSLSLQPSPSTANNVGILLASVQQTVPPKKIYQDPQQARIPGVVPGSGIALALAYYNYGLNLDAGHAHLYTNLGSLLKDLGQLKMAIAMYEQAVHCDGNFDIALANLANAVKDDGRIADAIVYYKRAVKVNPDFAEAVCGLANALNSVCGWAGRGGIATDGGKRDRWHVDEHGMLLDATKPGAVSTGWLKRVVDLVEKQLAEGEDWGRGSLNVNFVQAMLQVLAFTSNSQRDARERMEEMKRTVKSWSGQKWEGHRLVRMAERAIRRLSWQWYQDRWITGNERSLSHYRRPLLPSSLTVPTAPTVLPFHTFTCPMSAKQIRLISQRNGLRISVSTLKAPWMPQTVFEPPAPPNPYLKVGYVSSDFNNHPLAHLMQSVFGMHNRARVKAYCYATTMSDNSPHRLQIEREAPVFHDVHTWSAERLVQQIVKDGIHILINLNGYTRGARNEVFAARPAPIQMSFMGFAGTLGAEWCDYLLADDTAVPPSTLRPWRRNVDLEDQLVDENSGGDQEDWVYGENIIYCKNTFFCCDHRQSAPDVQGEQLDWEKEQARRWQMRKEIFPDLPDDVIILGNFNQLYKIEPTTFRTWLRILANLPKAILWLLRFPDVGETHLKQTALAWAGPEVASRVIFTDVAPKHQHISRARVCDLFLDTPECNAHTTAADVLWSGTPLLTLPRYPYKMCSRMAASILKGALPDNAAGQQAAKELIASDEADYERLAINLGSSIRYHGHRISGRLADLRRLLYESRFSSALFDTKRWVMDLEEAYESAWDRWVKGQGGDIWLRGSRPEGVQPVPTWWHYSRPIR